mmetsp:Transcript_42817/g.126859  ORF Transcript_42817/g.126859 Transcript_42817/m.126859 type:complete len:236 (+) Transcript_42817:1011-1718(+)
MASHMCGITTQQMPQKTETSTSPCLSAPARQSSTWICRRDRQIWSAFRRACLTCQIFSFPLPTRPTLRKFSTRCVRSALKLVSTSPLRKAWVRRCSMRSLRSSICTKPSSSSGSICMRRRASCGLRRSVSVSMHSRAQRRFRATSIISSSAACVTWRPKLGLSPAGAVLGGELAIMAPGAFPTFGSKSNLPREGSSWTQALKAASIASTVTTTSSSKQCCTASGRISTPGRPRSL